jgi:hypothetical protein
MASSFLKTTMRNYGILAEGHPENEAISLEVFLDSLVKKIQGCESVADADGCLTDLGVFQEELARIFFKFNVPLRPRLRRLVREFDRPDDHDLRVYTFKKLNNHRLKPVGWCYGLKVRIRVA